MNTSTDSGNVGNATASKAFLLALVALVALAGGFLFGYDTAVINGANNFLKDYFQLTPSQEGIAGASAILGCIPGAMFAGFVSDRFGRRRMLFFCAILYAMSGLLSAIPRTFGEFLAARFISGLGIGASSMICPTYVAEMAPAKWRGRFGTMFQFGIVLGIFLTLFINGQIQKLGDAAWNTATGWRWMMGAEIAPAIILLMLLIGAKESPLWLLQVGKEKKAREILIKIHGPSQAEQEILAAHASALEGRVGLMDLLLSRRFRKPLMIAVLLMVVSQFSGINAIMYYSTKIFTTAGVGIDNSFAASALIGLVNLLFTLVAIGLVDKAGRRLLLLVGLGIQAIALGGVGILFHMQHTGVESNALTIALLVGILVFIAAFAMALGPIPWILCSEIFPTSVRGRAMSVATFTIWTACYIVAQSFPILNESAWIGPAKTFWIYGLCSLLGFLFVWIAVPETKGKKLEEIEAEMIRKEDV